MERELLFSAISVLLGGGFLGSLVALWQAKKKMPAELDSIIVSGAESAVLSLEKALANETRRADRAEQCIRERDELIAKKDARIEALEKRLDTLQNMLDEAREELRSILRT